MKSKLTRAHREQLEALRQAYERELPEKVRVIEAAAAALPVGGGDRDALDAVYQLVHRLNGSSAIYGFESLRRAAAALETLLAEAMEGAGPAGTFAAQLAPLLEGLRSAVGLP